MDCFVRRLRDLRALRGAELTDNRLSKVPVMLLILPAPLDTIRAIRHTVLRPNQPYESTLYPADKDPDTIHLCGYLNDCPIAVASLYGEAPPDAPDADGAYRLRGMAVYREHQGQGHGARLLQECISRVHQHGADLLWCNARTTAKSFYARQGFEVVGEAFEIEGIGPHYQMVRQFA